MLTAESLLAHLPGPDQTAAHGKRTPGSTHQTACQAEEIVIWLSAWQGKHPPSLDLQAIVFAVITVSRQTGVSAYQAT